MDGIILIDKQAGMTSRDVVNKVSHILKTKRIGHTGTLDPMATGVLVLCVGKATKIAELITCYDKEYIAEVTVGIETDTLDISGTILSEIEKVNITKHQVNEILQTFIGESIQEVPKYSAIKVNGKRLYKYARDNQTVALPKKSIEIYDLSLIGDLDKINGKIKFKIKCHVSKGTYIRSLVRDIGLKLGYPACMSSLRRIKQGQFEIDDCYTIDDIEIEKYKMINVNDALSDIKGIVVDEEMESIIKNGSIIDKTFDDDMVRLINKAGDLLAIYKIYDLDNKKAKPYKMMV